MNERLPVVIENLELPKAAFNENKQLDKSYGYVSIMYLLSLLITLGSIIIIIVFGS